MTQNRCGESTTKSNGSTVPVPGWRGPNASESKYPLGPTNRQVRKQRSANKHPHKRPQSVPQHQSYRANEAKAVQRTNKKKRVGNKTINPNQQADKTEKPSKPSKEIQQEKTSRHNTEDANQYESINRTNHVADVGAPNASPGDLMNRQPCL